MKILIVFLFVSYLSSIAVCQDKTPVTQQPNKLVTLNVTVTNLYGDLITGLEAENFKVFDNKKEQQITLFRSQDDSMTVGVLLDASGSMLGSSSGKRLSKLILSTIKQGLTRFVNQSKNGNEYFMIGFNEKPQLLLDNTQDTALIKAALDKIDAIHIYGMTSLFDALYISLDKLGKAKYKKSALLVVTDGTSDNSSKYKFENIKESLKDSGIPVYSVALPDLDGQDSNSKEPIDERIEEISAINGGHVFYPRNPAEISEVFGKVADELRSQYSIGFIGVDEKSQIETKKNRWHSIEVKTEITKNVRKKVKGIYLRTRKGYYFNTAFNTVNEK